LIYVLSKAIGWTERLVSRTDEPEYVIYFFVHQVNCISVIV